MSGIIGAALAAASIILFAWAILAFRNPDHPAWIDRFLVLEMSACAMVAMLAFGVALALKYALSFAGAVGAGLSVAALATPVVAYVLVWRFLRIDAKLAEYDARKRPEEPAPAPANVEALRKQA